MNVSQAIALLAEAELKQLAVRKDKEAVLGFINLGILEIHKRFNLWQDEALITMVDGVSTYKLDGLDTNVTINLSDHDVLMVDEVYAPDGTQLGLNDSEDPNGVWTPQMHVIEILAPITTGDTSVIYRASPSFLTNEKQKIPIPSQLFEALFHYVGYRGHGSIKGDIKSENNTHYMRFTASCDLVESNGLVTQDSVHAHKFYDRGFV